MGFFKQKYIAVSVDDYVKYNKVQLSRWIDKSGGAMTTSITSETTHLVVSENEWTSKIALVSQALLRPTIKIVSHDWLEDSLAQATKKRETSYEWRNLERSLDKARKKEAKALEQKAATKAKQRALKIKLQERQQRQDAKARGNLTMQALKEHTDMWTGTGTGMGTGKRAKKSTACRSRERSVLSEEDVQEQKRSRAERAFKKGADAAKKDIGSDNHHIYRDEQGFQYDIVLTKVDTRLNKNERINITIYESNTTPPTYATYTKHGGTGLSTAGSVAAVLGSNCPTALRSFGNEFKKHTSKDWVQPLGVSGTGIGTGITTGTSHRWPAATANTARKRVPEKLPHESQEQMAQRLVLEFKALPFVYTPPVTFAAVPRLATPTVIAESGASGLAVADAEAAEQGHGLGLGDWHMSQRGPAGGGNAMPHEACVDANVAADAENDEQQVVSDVGGATRFFETAPVLPDVLMSEGDSNGNGNGNGDGQKRVEIDPTAALSAGAEAQVHVQASSGGADWPAMSNDTLLSDPFAIADRASHATATSHGDAAMFDPPVALDLDPLTPAQNSALDDWVNVSWGADEDAAMDMGSGVDGAMAPAGGVASLFGDGAGGAD